MFSWKKYLKDVGKWTFCCVTFPAIAIAASGNEFTWKDYMISFMVLFLVGAFAEYLIHRKRCKQGSQ